MEQGLYAQVVKISRKDLEFITENRNINESKFKSSKVNLQDHSVGFILTLIGLKSILAHSSLIFIGKVFRAMTIHKIQIHLNSFKFQ